MNDTAQNDGDARSLAPPNALARARTELRKLLTLRGTYLVAGLAVLVPVLATGLRVGLPGEDPAVEFPTVADRLELLGGSLPVDVLYLALGAMLTAGEWRHRTATPTFLAEPRRWRVVAAQVGVAALVGAVVGTVTTATVRLTATVVLTVRDAPTEFGPDQWATMLGAVIGATGAAVVGAGLGAVVRNPALTAVAVAAGGPMLQMIVGLLSTGVGEALSLPLAMERLVVEDGSSPLQLAGFLTLAGWMAVAVTLGMRRTATADIN